MLIQRGICERRLAAVFPGQSTGSGLDLAALGDSKVSMSGEHSIRSSEVVLVTGASGLLGQHLVRQLLERGYSVRALVRSATQAGRFSSSVQIACGDIRNRDDVFRAVSGCSYVLHACSTHVYNLPAQEMWDVNILGTRHICDAVENYQCERLVLTSTISALSTKPAQTTFESCLPPRQRNSLCKKIADELVSSRCLKGLPAVIVNPPFFVGPYDYSPSPFRLWIPVACICPVMFVPQGGFNVLGAADVARAHLWALEDGNVGAHYPIVGQNISLRDYVSLVNRAVGSTREPWILSSHVLKSLAHGRVFDPYVADLLAKQNFVELQHELPFALQPLEDVLLEAVQWFKRHSSLARLFPLMRYAYSHYH
jgi:dihydroflavonol-4-reductase